MDVVAKLGNLEMDRSVYGPPIVELKALLRGFDHRTITHVQRSCNGVAHSLAKDRCDNKVCKTWVGCRCRCLNEVLVFD
jgi:hypothetical protein